MKIALSFTCFLLVAGMSTPTTAQGLRELLSALNVDIEFLPRHADYISLLEPKDVVKSFRESCENNEALERFKESLIDFVPSAKIFQKLINGTFLHESVSTSYVTGVCRRLPTMLNATRSLINSYNNCLKPTIGYNNVATAESGVLLPLLEYVCKDNGTRLLEIIENRRSLNCMKNVVPRIATCVFNSLGSELERDLHIDESYAQFVLNFLMSADLSQEECRLIERAHVCVRAQQLITCDTYYSEMYLLADLLMEIIKRQTPCQRWVKKHPEKSPESESPPLTVHPTSSSGEKIAIPEDPRGWFILLIRSQDEVVANLKKDCDKYAATNDLESNVAGFILDLISIATRLLSVQISIEDSRMDKQMIIFVREFCYSAPYFPTYPIKKLLNSYENCLGPNKRDDVDAEGGVLVALLEHACKNNGSELLGVLQDENSHCVMSAVQSFDRCVNRSPITFSYAKEHPIQLLKHILTSNLHGEDCQFVSNIRSCIDESAKRCDEDHKVKEIILGIIQIVDKHLTSCKN